ncbi:MAG: hypothetical protein HW421_2917 [Ignavibacteria bacterium]|nr:hypothetical protein [Ignavibacteria bacterium]
MKFVIVIMLLIVFQEDALLSHGGGFIENRGQWSPQVKFLQRKNNVRTWLTDSGLVFDYRNVKSGRKDNFSKSGRNDEISVSGNVVKMKFVDCNKYTYFTSKKESAYYNYFLGNNRENWKTHVPCYSECTLKNIYSGIDLKIYEKNNLTSYDFILEPGAEPSSIKITFEGADDVFTNSSGELIIRTSLGDIKHFGLKAYQLIDNKEHEVKCSFNINKQKEISFNVANYDANHALIIDPNIYSTFISGSYSDETRDLVVDNYGFAYICGYTSSEDYPVTPGAYSDYTRGSATYTDAFVTKLDTTGTKLIFSTYIGSIFDDRAESIALDSSLDMLITGYFKSSKYFPVTIGSYDSSSKGGFDIFVIKLNSNGDALKYSFIFGGKGDDFAQGIALNVSGDVYITGYSTGGKGFQVSDSAFQNKNKGGTDAFVAKFSSDSSKLIYSTFLGGSQDDFGNGIALDTNGFACITGTTRSNIFPTTAGAFSRTFSDTATVNNTECDAFIAKLNDSATSIIFSTYLGGKAPDGAYDIAVDDSNNCYVTGFTGSADFPFTPSSFDTVFGNKSDTIIAVDAFVTELNSSGSFLEYSTFIGGSFYDYAYTIKLDKFRNAIITGNTTSSDFPVTPYATDTSYNDTSKLSDAFVSIINPRGDQVFYSTFIGGSKPDIGNAVAIGPGVSFICAGTTASDDFPHSINAYDTLFIGTSNNCFVTKINPVYYLYGQENKQICSGDSVYIGMQPFGNVSLNSYTWTPATGLNSNTLIQPKASPVATTTYFLKADNGFGGIIYDTVFVDVIPKPIVTISGPDTVRIGVNTIYTAQFYDLCQYTWEPTGGYVLNADINAATIVWTDSLSGNLRLTTLTDEGCASWDEKNNIFIISKFNFSLQSSGSNTFCLGDSLVLDAGKGYQDYQWSNGKKTQTIIVKTSSLNWVRVIDTYGTTGYSDTIRAITHPTPQKPTIVKKGKALTCNITSLIYEWYINGNEIANSNVNQIIPDQSGDYQVEVTNSYGCSKISDKYKFVSSVEEINKGNIRITPNPATDIVTIELTQSEPTYINIEIYNLLGEKLFSIPKTYIETQYSTSFNLESAPRGIYYIKVTTGSEISTEKLILN